MKKMDQANQIAQVDRQGHLQIPTNRIPSNSQ